MTELRMPPPGVPRGTRVFVRARSRRQISDMRPMIELGSIYRSRCQPEILITSLESIDRERLSRLDLEVIPATRYEPLSVPGSVHAAVASHPHSLTDVLTHIRADQAWQVSRGEGVHIAIVDTGVCGTMSEFAGDKQSPFSWTGDGSVNSWTDAEGHGSMVACIATGTTASGGRYNGVAPDATLIACKTGFDDTELYEIYDHLIDLVETGKIQRLVINNSFGHYVCSPPAIRPDDPFPGIVALAAQKGIVPVFAAGNNHVVVCGKDPQECKPNTIWGPNSLDEVLSVGTVNRNNRMSDPPATGRGYSHRDSSRGPGQLARATVKPDCVAPTYGEVMWGCGYQAMEWWGTSGAAPQVAGLAALMLAKNPGLTPAQIHTMIRESCVSIGLEPTCAGAGLIDCLEAVKRA